MNASVRKEVDEIKIEKIALRVMGDGPQVSLLLTERKILGNTTKVVY